MCRRLYLPIIAKYPKKSSLFFAFSCVFLRVFVQFVLTVYLIKRKFLLNNRRAFFLTQRMKHAKYILILLAANAAFSSGAFCAEKKEPEWKKRLPAVMAEMREDCSAYTARKMSEQNKSAVIYQIYMRAFTPEGTIKAAEKMLPHLKELGVDVVYTCPLALADDDADRKYWSRRQKTLDNPRNPYRIKDYFKTDPEYGADADLKSFVQTAHKLGMRVMFDLVYYHCGPTANLLGMDKDFVRRDSEGNVILGRWNFPELNFENPKLREYLWGNMEYFIKEFDIDGYRTDVEHYVPIDFWEEGARRVRKLKPDFLMLAESSRPRCQVEVYDINYATFFKAASRVYAENAPASAIVESEKKLKALLPKNARVLRYTENHDEAMNYGTARPDMAWPEGAHDSLIFMCFTLDGTPLIYNGVEIADNARHHMFSNRDFGKMRINWAMAMTPKGKARFAFYQELIRLRKTLPALHDDTWAVWLENTAPASAVSYARVFENQKLVGVVNTRNEPLEFSVDVSGIGAQKIFTSRMERGARYSLEGGKLKMKLAPFGFALLELR